MLHKEIAVLSHIHTNAHKRILYIATTKTTLNVSMEASEDLLSLDLEFLYHPF